MRATNGHVRLRHLPASAVRANRRHAEPEVSGDLRSGPPLRPWVRLIAHTAKLRQVRWRCVALQRDRFEAIDIPMTAWIDPPCSSGTTTTAVG